MGSSALTLSWNSILCGDFSGPVEVPVQIIHNPDATVDDGSCEYQRLLIHYLKI